MKTVTTQQSTQIVELSEIQKKSPTGVPLVGGNIGLIQGVKVTLTVIVGEAFTTVGELMDLKEMSVLKLEKHVDHPVDVLVDGNIVARGQLVAVDDNFGVRITEIASAN